MAVTTKIAPREPRGRKPVEWKRYASGSEADHFARFCKQFLVQSVDAWDGLPLELEPFEKRLMGEALAYDSNGLPIWNSTVICLPRKNGKTTLLAAYAIYRLLTSDGMPEILLTASSDKQAGRLFEAAATFVRRNAELAKLCRVREYIGEILREDGLGKILRMASDPGKLHGYNPSLVICDELAQWNTPMLKRAYAALTSGGGARCAPQVFTITTAGEAQHRHDSILGRILDAGLEASDTTSEPGLLISRLHDAQMLVWSYEAPTTDAHDYVALKVANPASWITKDYLRRQAENPELSDAEVLQLHGCVWAESATTWIGPDKWDARKVPRELEPGEKIVLGFDGSYRRDATALVACTLDGFISPIAVWERPSGAPDDWKIPRSEVDVAVEGAMERYDVAELACDPPGWHKEIEDWAERYGAEVVVEFATNQRQRMIPACDRFRVAVLEGDLSHAGHPVLSAHVGHCVPKETPYGITIGKDGSDSPRKIDAAVAAVVAYDRAMWHAANSQPKEILVAYA